MAKLEAVNLFTKEKASTQIQLLERRISNFYLLKFNYKFEVEVA